VEDARKKGFEDEDRDRDTGMMEADQNRPGGEVSDPARAKVSATCVEHLGSFYSMIFHFQF